MFVPQTWMAIDAISACVLVVLAAVSREGSVLRERERRVFRYAILVFLAFIAVDALVHLLGADPVVSLAAAYAAHAFSAACVVACLVYASTCVERRRSIPRPLAAILVAFCLGDAILLALNPSTGWLFEASLDGAFARGWLWWGQAAYLMLCVLAVAVYYVAARVRVSRSTSRSLLVFVLILLAGIACQLFVSQVMVLPAFFALASLVRYADGQVEALSLDYLTGLRNRLALDAKLTRLAIGTSPFGALYLEVDDFDQIVRRYGRVSADALLAEFGAMLSRTLRINDTVGRFSEGDFLAIVDAVDEAGLVVIESRLRCEVERFNRESAFGRPVEVSIGTALLEPVESADDVDAGVQEELLRSYLKRLEDAMQADRGQRRFLREKA